MSDAITSRRLEQRGNSFGTAMLFECMVVCVVGPAHECERVLLFNMLIVKKKKKKLTDLLKFSHSSLLLDWTALSWILFCFVF